MKRMIAGAMFVLPLIATSVLSKPASALEVNVNPQIHRYSDRPTYAQRYEQREWTPRHYEYRNQRRVFVPGHYEDR